MMTKTPLVILPAAGFGTRVGSPESKELLSGLQGSPLIENALKQALARHWPVHVITRKEKKSLIKYLEGMSQQTGLEISIQIIEPSREWPDSVLKSKPHWREKNLLCLPDTVFEPLGIWEDLVGSRAEVAAATFLPPDPEKWGVMRLVQQALEICEKPTTAREGQQAWGLIAFTPKAGEKLLQAQLESTFDHQWRNLEVTAEFFQLQHFADLTRPNSNSNFL